ncbi:unnamed protein product, partial [marine sediment metagenome]
FIWLFYPFNLTLGFLSFLILGLWVSTNTWETDKKAIKEFSFSDSPQKAFFTMMLCIFLIVGSLLGNYHIIQKYRANLAYSQGLELMVKQDPDLDQVIQKISEAINLDAKDTYFRDLSEVFLFQINEIISNQDLGEEEKQELFQQIVSNTEAAATTAVQINQGNSENWLQLAAVYENFALFGIEGTQEVALLNYTKTSELDPQNPQVPLNIGRVYKTAGDRIKAQIALQEQETEEEQGTEELEKAAEQSFDSALQF